MSLVNQKTKENCKRDVSFVMPVIDHNKCEAKDKCTATCPYSVFEIRPLTEEERSNLSFFVRFKVRVHEGKQDFALNVKDCHACSECIKSCPEKAIKLIKVI